MPRPKIKLIEPRFPTPLENVQSLQQLTNNHTLMFLARDLGVNIRTIQRWEEGSVPPQIAVLLKLLTSFPVNLWPEDLMPNTRKMILAQYAEAVEKANV